MPEHRLLTVHIGHHELVIRRRYEVVSICNDILIAAWFIAGSIMFFYSSMMVPGTWCFLIGSIELLIRPAIRLTRLVHIRSIQGQGGSGGTSSETAMDF